LWVVTPMKALPHENGRQYTLDGTDAWPMYKTGGCPYCQRGEPFGRRIPEAYEQDALTGESRQHFYVLNSEMAMRLGLRPTRSVRRMLSEESP
jgi:hypothetical protein